MKLEIISPDGIRARVYVDDRELHGVTSIEIKGKPLEPLEVTIGCYLLVDGDSSHIRLNPERTNVMSQRLRFVGENLNLVEGNLNA